MPRRARLVIPHLLHHVTQRGNYRQKVFFERQDYAVYMQYFAKYSEKYGVTAYAYCLMPNHVHFIVKPCGEDSLARTFQLVHQRYAYYFHKRRESKGHLWEQRFYSCVLYGRHIEHAIRYVEQNPVRSGMVRYPWGYVWSSARHHLGHPYNVLRMGDVSEYVQVDSWKSFLLKQEQDRIVEAVRKVTRRGLMFAEKGDLEMWEKKLGIKLGAKKTLQKR